MLAGCPLRAMTRANMTNFMAHHARQVSLTFKVHHDAACDVNVTARQRKGIDFWAVKHGKNPLKISALQLSGQPLSDVIDVGLYSRIF